jgi:phenylalanyl-tRNA synthetase alpha chain
MDPAELETEAQSAIADASTLTQLDDARVRYLGRKSALKLALREVRDRETGMTLNAVRERLEAAVAERQAGLERAELDRAVAEERIDVTLPGTPRPRGHLHLVTQVRREVEDIFLGMGYEVVDGREVETPRYLFDALNMGQAHPTRSPLHTFYLDEGRVLRSETSPSQIHAMEEKQPPVYIVTLGRCYRRDTADATHYPIFHQVEGLAVGTEITLADLKGTLDEFARAIFGPERETRFRPDFFPFTEPSVQVDVSCFHCGGTGRLADGSRDPICKGIGWIEILGAGMVDPNVYGFVRENGYDPENVQGFAFGMGIERIAMLKYGVPDLRKFFENDIRVLGQFR